MISEHHPKVYLITGSSSGLGYSLAKEALAAGHKVIVTSRNPSRTADKVAEIKSLGSLWAKLDASSSSLEDDFRDAIGLFDSKMDVLINNTAVVDESIVEDLDFEVARNLFETNFWGPIRLSKLLIPVMRSQGSGTILNISSTTSIDPLATTSVYGASKAVLDAFTTALASQVATFNIRLLVGTPAGIRTPFVEKNVSMDSLSGFRPEYKGSVVESMLDVYNSLELFRIDPDWAAAVIVQAADGTSPFEGKGGNFLSFPLGGDTVDKIKSRIEELSAVVQDFSDGAKSVELEPGT